MQTHLSRDKKRRLEEFECEEMEQQYRSQETRKFYKKLNASRKGFVPRAEMCRETHKGLRQGDGLSCLLFNIALEGVMKWAGFNLRGTIFNKSSQFICFADDVDIVGRTSR